MKIYLVILSFTAMTAFAQTPSLSDQLSLTSDAITQLMQDVAEHSTQAALNIPEYHRWEAKFNRELENRLHEYELGVERNVFLPIQTVLSQYMAVYEDPSMPPEQKEILLQSFIRQLDTLKPVLSENYATLAKQLYFYHNMLPGRPALETFSISYYGPRGDLLRRPDFGKPRGHRRHPYYFRVLGDVRLRYGAALGGEISRSVWVAGNSDSFEGTQLSISAAEASKMGLGHWRGILNKDQKFWKSFISTLDFNQSHLKIMDTCRSRLCADFIIGKLVFFLSSVKNLIQRDIEISLPRISGRHISFKIEKPSFPVASYIKLLTRTDYSAEYLAMPFEGSTDELPDSSGQGGKQ